MTVHLIQNAFNAGELSPSMLGRFDLPYYKSGLKTLENWLILPQGGIRKRPGTRFVRPVEDQTVVGRLVPFVFSTEQAYIIEFCDDKIRFFMNEGSVLRTGTNISAINLITGQITSNAHGATTGEMVYISGIVGTTQLNNRHFTVTVVDPNTITLDGEDLSGYDAWVSGGTVARVYELTSTGYTEAELPYLRFAQSADQLFITHEDHAPAVLTRTGHTAWTLTDHNFIDGPYLELREREVGEGKLADTITLAVAAEFSPPNRALTAGGAGFFESMDVGRILRYGKAGSGTAWGAIEITDYTNATTAEGEIVAGDDPVDEPPHLPGNVASKYWYLSAYYASNYPRAIAFFEQRLAFAGTPLQPERFDASVTDGWDDFRPIDRFDVASPEVLDDDALSYQLAGASEVQVILWLATITNLVIGTTGGIYVVQASSLNEAVTPTNINVPRISAYGTKAVQPITAFDSVVYVSRTGKKILTAAYSDDALRYRTEDLTILADHITGSGISFMEYQQEPNSIVWCLRGDGQLAGMTFERGQKVFGWHRQIIGGSFGSGDAVVESIAVIPSPNADHDQLWMIVKRTVDGSTVRYIEFLEQDFADDDDEEDAFFVDSGLTYDGTATDEITGLNHLEGETVRVLADGAVHPDCVVDNGAITLDDDYSVVHAGLGYESIAETLPIAFGDSQGASVGRLIRPVHLYLRLHRTLNLEFGTDADNLNVLPFRSTLDAMDAAPPLFTGIKEIPLHHGHNFEGRVYLRHADPCPATILYMGGEVGVSPR